MKSLLIEYVLTVMHVLWHCKSIIAITGASQSPLLEVWKLKCISFLTIVEQVSDWSHFLDYSRGSVNLDDPYGTRSGPWTCMV